jgi:hypothetical protein
MEILMMIMLVLQSSNNNSNKMKNEENMISFSVRVLCVTVNHIKQNT